MKNIFWIVIFISPLMCWAQAETKTNAETIIITRKGSSADKLKIEIDGRNITVNGKNVNDDTTISIQRMKGTQGFPRFELRRMEGNERMNLDSFFNRFNSNKAFLGVATDETETGLVIKNVVEESAAQKSGLKEGDIIVSIDGVNVKTPDELSAIIGKKKPGSIVKINYKRDKKNESTDAVLTKAATGFNSFRSFELPMNLNGPFGKEELDVLKNWDRNNFKKDLSFNSSPKLGIQIEDDENSDVVKITKVEAKSVAQFAGLKEGDIITKIDEKPVTSVADAFNKIEVAKRKQFFTIGISRNGKQQDVKIKLAKKVMTRDL